MYLGAMYVCAQDEVKLRNVWTIYGKKEEQMCTPKGFSRGKKEWKWDLKIIDIVVKRVRLQDFHLLLFAHLPGTRTESRNRESISVWTRTDL